MKLSSPSQYRPFTSHRHRTSQVLLCRASINNISSENHIRYLTDIACIPTNRPFDALFKVLQTQGNTIISPSDRQGLHPLLIPISTNDSNQVTCFLRWPEGHKGMELPIVRMSRGSPSVELISRSVEEYIHRALAEEDVVNNNTTTNTRPIADAAGADGASLYQQGSVIAPGPALYAYLVKKAGMYCDVSEALAQQHLNKGDTMSAMITGEWYMRQGHFPEWGRPYEFNWQLLEKVERNEESRDVARIALRMPWWTFKDGFAATRDKAQLYNKSADEVRAALDDQDEMANGGPLKGKFRTNPKTDKQKYMDEARHVLNRGGAGEVAWDDTREELSEWYEKAGLVDVSRFVLG